MHISLAAFSTIYLKYHRIYLRVSAIQSIHVLLRQKRNLIRKTVQNLEMTSDTKVIRNTFVRYQKELKYEELFVGLG